MLVSKKHRKLVLHLREPGKVTAIIPTAREFTFKGRRLVAVPHRLDEVRVLRNIGIDAPAPMDFYYDWPGLYPPFAHQRITAAFLATHPRAFCLNGMGSGKTLAVLWAFDYLRKQGLVRRLLVVGPLSTLERTWGDEVFRHFPEWNFAAVHGAREKRHKLLEGDYDVFAINHDGIKSKETLQRIIAREDIDLIVFDELAVFRNQSTDRWKAANALAKTRQCVWGLTGTPTPNAPTDAYAQIKLVNPSRAPRHFGQFRDMTMRQLSQFKWVPREGATQVVHDCMQPAVRFATADCVDLPPTTFITREAELTPAQQRAYKEMLDRLRAEVAGSQITAVNEAVKLGKLVQICSGTAYTPDGEVTIPAHTRIELVREIIEEAEGKVIVFVPFTAALQHVAEALARDFTVEVVHGQTPKAVRDRVFGAFQRAADPRVLVANAAAMSHGLTLTAANVIVWFAPITSAEVYEQANARIVRPGQKRHTTIVHIEGSAVERQMYARLQKKGRMQGLLLDLFRRTNS